MPAQALVMLIDDDAAICDMYRYGLERHGFRVAVVSDINLLAAEITREVPDVVLLDWELGAITGGDVLDRLRTDPRTADTPVFMISNHPQETDEDRRSERLGALAWLIKSRTTPDELAGRLREALPETDAC